MQIGTKQGGPTIRRTVVFVAALSLISTLAPASHAYKRPGEVIERVSMGTNGRQTEGDGGTRADMTASGAPTVSANGRWVAFASRANDLDPNDDLLLGVVVGDRDVLNVFLHDRKTKTTQLVSGTYRGDLPELPELGGNSTSPVISANGRWVAFASDVMNLVENDLNKATDIFVWDRKNNKTERVSVASDGSEADEDSQGIFNEHPVSISGDGRYIAFSSTAGNLTEEPVSGCLVDAAGIRRGPCNNNIYVHDRQSKQTRLVSPGRDGSAADANSYAPSISESGKYVVFASDATNLTINDDNVCLPGFFTQTVSCRDVFIYDLDAKQLELVSVGVDGTSAQGDGFVGSASIGPVAVTKNGRFVAFNSGACDLVPNHGSRNCSDRPGHAYVRDREQKRTYRVSVSSTGMPFYCSCTSSSAGEEGGGASLDASGRYYVLEGLLDDKSRRAPPAGNYPCDADQCTAGTDACSGCEGGTFVYDLRTGAQAPVMTVVPPPGKHRLSVNESMPTEPSIRYDGREVLFWSKEPLVPDDTNENFDVFVYDRGAPLGTGGFLGSPPKGEPDPPPDDRICVVPDVCIPPLDAASWTDGTDDLDDVLTQQGANLFGASLAYRPQYQDVFAAIELEAMPQVLPGLSPIFYGLSFNVAGKSFEVRASSLLGGTFELFDCTDSQLCEKVAALAGGYGTTGERVVFSLPLSKLGLEDGGGLSDVKAYSALGSPFTGAHKTLDELRFD